MSRTLVQISLLTLLAFAFQTGAFAQSSANPRAGEVIGNNAGSRMSVIKEPLRQTGAKHDAGFAHVSATIPAVRVTVIGQVTNPGVYEFRNGAPDLMEVVTQAGNLTRFCGHEFFVWRSDKEQWPLDPRKDAGFKFEDGDILLAETSTRYYSTLGSGAAVHTLKEIHPVTQIVLLNVLDRPVFLAVPPEDATLVYVLSLLNQTRAAMPGVEPISPPNASAVPDDALIAPDKILSGSILKFVPGKIDRSKLPPLPEPVLVKQSSRVQQLSAEAGASGTNRLRQPGSLMVQQVKSDTSPPFDTGLIKVTPANTNSEAEVSDNPFDDPFAEFETKSDEVLKSGAPEILEKAEEVISKRPLLSTQQWRIIVTFVMLMSLFLAAWYIRYRQQKSGARTITFVESHTSDRPAPEPVRSEPEMISEPVAAATLVTDSINLPAIAESIAKIIEPQIDDLEVSLAHPEADGVLELDGLKQSETDQHADAPLSHGFELSAYDSPRSEDYFDEKTYEVSIEDLGSSPEIEVFDPVESPGETAAEAIAAIRADLTGEEPSRESLQHESLSDDEDLESPASRVQQSILGTPWIQELSDELDPLESDISLEEQAIESPAAEADIEEAQPQDISHPVSGRFASHQLRFDQAHTQQPQPVKRPQVEEASPEGKLHESDAKMTQAEPPEQQAAQSKWLKMADAPRQPEEKLDHIFQAIMRERKK